MNQMPVSIILNINKEDTFQAAEQGGREEGRKGQDKKERGGRGGGGRRRAG